MQRRLRRHDLLFLIETLMPGREDKERVADVIQGDSHLIEAMLDDERLFRRLTAGEDILLHVSPWLFFTVLLRRARRDLAREAFTVELRHRQKVFLFDTDRVVQLLEQEELLDYLATMLSSFTRIQSVTVRVRVRERTWRRYRASELDVESLIRYCQTLDEEFRFEPYRRIGDVCLFLAGMFPEYIHAQYRYPLSSQLRPRAKSRLCTSLEDYEAHGQAFYRLAAEHEMAKIEGLDSLLKTLSESFILAEKALNFLANHYLLFVRHKLFEY